MIEKRGRPTSTKTKEQQQEQQNGEALIKRHMITTSLDEDTYNIAQAKANKIGLPLNAMLRYFIISFINNGECKITF